MDDAIDFSKQRCGFSGYQIYFRIINGINLLLHLKTAVYEKICSIKVRKMTIIFETHSTSIDNQYGIASGHNDSPLSKIGVSQAQELGKRYNPQDINALYCSDLKRAKKTAQIAFQKKVMIIEEPRLREWNYGIYNGSSSITLETLKLKHINQPFPKGESLFSALERVNHCIDSILQTHENTETVLIIGHRIVFYALEHRFKKCSLEDLITQPWAWQPGWHYGPCSLLRSNL